MPHSWFRDSEKLHSAFITGISGFAGPYLATHLLSQGVACVGISHGLTPRAHPVSLAGVTVHDVDIRDRTAVRKILAHTRPERVFHLAAMSHVASTHSSPEVTFDVNVTGTFNLLEGLRQLSYPVRTVFVSSGNLYGNIDSGEGGFTEEDPVHATSPYASSKLIGEHLVHSYVEDFGLDVVIARPFNHTGPGQPSSFACPEFARAIAEGVVHRHPVHLRTGPLEPRRDISDVRDVVRAYALLAERGVPGEIYNICSGSMTSMSEVVAMFADLAHVNLTTQLEPSKVRGREIMRSGGDRAKIRGLGWQPEIPLIDTLQSVLDYWIDQVSGSGKAS